MQLHLATASSGSLECSGKRSEVRGEKNVTPLFQSGYEFYYIYNINHHDGYFCCFIVFRNNCYRFNRMKPSPHLNKPSATRVAAVRLLS